MEHRRLAPGTLWAAIERQTAHALRCGALQPIDTVQAVIESGVVRFVVRQVSSLTRKEQQRRQARKLQTQKGPVANPFLPYEPDLFVADISDTHLALLNKFNVIDHHLLIVTRDFQRQEALLDHADFDALMACMAEFDGIGFYNGGPEAGASQPHKHLQIVPLPLDGHALPIEPFIEAAHTSGVFRAPQLAFAHAAAWLDDDAAANLHATYLQLMNAIGVQPFDVAGVAHQSAPYNLLVTRRWMLAVPRSVSHVEGVAVNALGFAGSLFVRDDAQRNVVETLGPMKLLADATIS